MVEQKKRLCEKIGLNNQEFNALIAIIIAVIMMIIVFKLTINN